MGDLFINHSNLVDDGLVYPFEKVVLRLPLAFVSCKNSLSVINSMVIDG